MKRFHKDLLERARELYPEHKFEFVDASKHAKIVVSKDDKSRFVVVSQSPSDHHAFANALKTVKKVVGELAA